MIEYKTVEGHPIVRDGEYETREGSIARCWPAANPIGFLLGYIKQDGSGLALDGTWSKDGLCCRDKVYDLMRPWNKKEDAHPDIEAHRHDALNYLVEGVGSRTRPIESAQLKGSDKKADADGWINIDQRRSNIDCPVDDDVGFIEVKTRNGSLNKGVPSKLNWEWNDHVWDIMSYRIVKQPVTDPHELKKKTYKLSEMWKIWWHVQKWDLITLEERDKIQHIQTRIFYSKSEALKFYTSYPDNFADDDVFAVGVNGECIAITPADATEFYEGEGL